MSHWVIAMEVWTYIANSLALTIQMGLEPVTDGQCRYVYAEWCHRRPRQPISSLNPIRTSRCSLERLCLHSTPSDCFRTVLIRGLGEWYAPNIRACELRADPPIHSWISDPPAVGGLWRKQRSCHVLRTTIFYVTIGKEKENGVCFYNRCCSIAKFSLTLIDINTLQQLKN